MNKTQSRQGKYVLLMRVALLAALMITLLVALTLVGCGGQEKPADTDSKAAAQNEAPSAPEETPVPAEEPRAALRSQKAFVDEFNAQMVAQGLPIGDGLPYPDPKLDKDHPRNTLELETNNYDTADPNDWAYIDINLYVNIDDKTGEDLITGIELDAGADKAREVTKAAIVAYSEGMTLEEADQIVTKTKADQGYWASENRAFTLKYEGYYYSFARGYFSIVTEPYNLESFEFYNVEGNDGKEAPVETDASRDAIVAKLLPPGVDFEAGSTDAYFASTTMTFADVLQWYDNNLTKVGFKDETPEEIALMVGDPLDTGFWMVTGTIDGKTLTIGVEEPSGITLSGEELVKITILFD
jgi:hypothetical protein